MGTSLIDRKEIKVAHDFRYVILENDYLKDIQLFYHRLVESFKHAYAKRSKFGDEEFINMKPVIKSFLKYVKKS